MSDRSLRVALVAGPMYDGLYRHLVDFERLFDCRVDVAFHAPHPQLNAHLAALSQVDYDLVSTHTKYAPSQLSFLSPLDAFEPQLALDAFYAPLTDLARIDGFLYGLPRNIDVKLLHFRTDLIDEPPADWDQLLSVACKFANRSDLFGFVFPGMESGLFGLFYELAAMGGADLFPSSNAPRLDNAGGVWALSTIRELYRSGAVPREIINWQYDEAHACFRNGHAAMICDWPGYYASYRDAASSVHDRFQLARMPAGPTGVHKGYSGAHTFALTKQGAAKARALDLLRFLTSPELQLAAAREGSVATRPAVLRQILSESSPAEADRWRLLDRVIANDMLIPPRLPYYPEIEEILWRTVRSAMIGEIDIPNALLSMELRILDCHQRHRLAG